MQPQELERRQERAERETWLIAETENGYRIHSPTSGGRPYPVTGISDALRCTCPDFEHHEDDPEWRCKHVLAVSARYGLGDNGVATSALVRPIALGSNPAEPSCANTVMLLKRSVSPDGLIDSLSVEFSCPVQEDASQAVVRQAELLLELQAEIVEGFLGKNARPVSPTPRPDHRTTEGTGEPAELLRVGDADGKAGRLPRPRGQPPRGRAAQPAVQDRHGAK